MKMRTTKGGKKIIEADDKGMAFAKPLLMKHRILVADDDSSIRDIFKIILVRAGYDLELIEDANEIFNNNFKIPDLFLIDKLLSGVDGLQVCRYLKDNPGTCNIPVVMVSASPDIGVSAIKAGADDFVEKPFELSYLLKVIERNINGAKNGRPLKEIQNKQDN